MNHESESIRLNLPKIGEQYSKNFAQNYHHLYLEFGLFKEDIFLIEEFLENLKKQNKSPQTVLSYAHDLKRFLEWLNFLKHKPLKDLRAKDISEYIQYLKNGGFLYQEKKPQNLLERFTLLFKTKKVFYKKRDSLSINAQKRHLSTIKNFFQFLKETHEEKGKHFLTNPVKSKLHHIKLKDHDIAPTPMLSREDFLELEEKIYRTKERLILYLLYYGGLRLSELAQLKFRDFSIEAKSIRLHRKGGDIHQLKIENAEKVFSQFEFYLKTKIENHRLLSTNLNSDIKEDYLFTNKEGLRLTERALFNLIKKMITKSGLSNEISPHSFRKACATELYLKTKDLLLVRDYLNHSDAKVTQTYIDKLTIHRYADQKTIQLLN